MESSAARRRISRHIANFSSEDERAGSRSERYLIRIYGPRALPELLEACSHQDPRVRFRAVWALGHTKHPDAFAEILRLTDDEDEGVRYDAVVALGIHGDERALPELIRIWKLEDDSRPAAYALARMGPKGRSAAEETLKSDSALFRTAAVSVLGGYAVEHGDNESRELVRKCLSDPDPEVREEAEEWLSDLAAKESDLRPA